MPRPSLTVDQVEKVCAACAQRMRKNNIRKLFLDVPLHKQIPARLLQGLCASLGREAGFDERCKAADFGDLDVTDKAAFCAFLARECGGPFE